MAESTPSLGYLSPILHVLNEGVYIVDAERQIKYWNSAAEAITGYSAEAVVGRHCYDNILRHVSEDGRQLCVEGCPLQATLNDSQPRDLVAYLHHKDGKRLPAHIRSILFRDESGEARVLEVFEEISDRKELLRELEVLRREVFTDALTGIGNRRYYELTGEARLAAYRVQKISFGLLMFDIDKFKDVNDRYGHVVGDRAIRMVAGTIARAVRALDTVARFGGDEFAVLVPNCTREYLAAIGDRICALVASSWLDLEDDTELGLTLSGGGTIAIAGDTLASMTKRADKNLYVSKTRGGDCVTIED